jgi:hypothetical protein
VNGFKWSLDIGKCALSFGMATSRLYKKYARATAAGRRPVFMTFQLFGLLGAGHGDPGCTAVSPGPADGLPCPLLSYERTAEWVCPECYKDKPEAVDSCTGCETAANASHRRMKNAIYLHAEAHPLGMNLEPSLLKKLS